MTIRLSRPPSISGGSSSRASATALSDRHLLRDFAGGLTVEARPRSCVCQLFSDPMARSEKSKAQFSQRQDEDSAALPDRSVSRAAGTARRGVLSPARRLRADHGTWRVQTSSRSFVACSTSTTGALRAPQSTQFLDYQVVNSDIEAERDHLRVGASRARADDEGGHRRDPAAGARRAAQDSGELLRVTEWTPLPQDKARKEVVKAPPSLQHFEDRLHLAVGQRPRQDESARRAGR